MKQLLTFCFLLIAICSFGQTIRPDQQTTKTPALTDAIYTQEDGALKKVLFSAFVDWIIDTYAQDTSLTNEIQNLSLNSDSLLISSGIGIKGSTLDTAFAVNDSTLRVTYGNGTTYDIEIKGGVNTGGGGGGAVSSVFGRTGVVVAATSDYDANQIDNTPAGNIAATDLQSAVNELDTEKLSAEVDGSITNEGSLTVAAGTAATSEISSNTSGSSNVILSEGTGIDIDESGQTITITNTVTDTDTQLTDEQVQDKIGAMVTGNTETGITVTYEDGDGTLDFVVTGGGGGDFADGGEAGGANRTIGNTDAFDIGILTNNVERLRVNSDGDVLIGTTTASKRLTVYDNTDAQAEFSGFSPFSSVTGDGYIKVGGSANDYLRIIYSGNAGDVYFENTYNNSAGDFRFRTKINGTPTNALVIEGDGNIGIGVSDPNDDAALDIVSTTGALIVPRMTTTQRDALTATDGMIIYNTTTNAFNFYENGSWVTK